MQQQYVISRGTFDDYEVVMTLSPDITEEAAQAILHKLNTDDEALGLFLAVDHKLERIPCVGTTDDISFVTEHGISVGLSLDDYSYLSPIRYSTHRKWNFNISGDTEESVSQFGKAINVRVVGLDPVKVQERFESLIAELRAEHGNQKPSDSDSD